MKEAFIEKKFNRATTKRIEQANGIIAEYMGQGFSLTLRQLYYQFVARGIIPNNLREYKKLGDTLNQARLAGLVDWRAIEDRTRYLRGYDASETTPEQAIDDAAEGYALPRWKDQPYAIEVWIEKDALTGVIEPVCSRWRLDYFSCRGYVSQSEQYKAGKRFARYEYEGRTPIILHLGDHDPSGKDMTRDNRDRFAMFAEMDVEVRRLALNIDQVRKYNPPPNPAKLTDSRAQGYIAEFGRSSWELDALDPKVIDALIEDEVKAIVDMDLWRDAEAREEKDQTRLRRFSGNFAEIEEWLDHEGL